MTAASSYLSLLLGRLGPAPSPQDVADGLVPETADLVQVFLVRAGAIQLVAFRHIDPDHHPVLEELGRVYRPAVDHAADPVAHVIRSGEARLSTWVRREAVERATPDARVHAIFDVIQPRNIVIVPLQRDGERYGAMVVAMSSSSRQFMEGDLEFMRELAQHLGPRMATSG